VFDGSNLGLGVTPSAWGGYTVFQNKAVSLASAANVVGFLSGNAYSDGTWKYVNTGAACQYAINNGGQHQWYTAPSGTAGNAISFTQAMTLDASGNLLVGTTSGSYKITCNGQPGANGYTAWTNYSDAKLKENVVDYYGGLSDVLKLRPVTFNYNELSGYDDETRKRRISGFIAQELKLIRPEMVGNTEIDGVEYYDTNTSDLNLLLIKAIQEQQAIIEQLTARITTLEAK
jgi:hypothetical protein